MSRALTTATIHRAAVRRRRSRTLVTAVVAAAAMLVAPAAYGASGTTGPQGAPAAGSHAAVQASTHPSTRTANTTKPQSPAAKAAAALPGVVDLTVSATTFRSLTLGWSLPSTAHNAGKVTQIVVRRMRGRQAPTSPTVGTLVARLAPSAVRVSDGHLAPGTSYSYAVFTLGADGTTGGRSAVTAMTPTTDHATGMSGRVADAAGRPILGATVFLESRDGNADFGYLTTNGAGRWAATGLVPGQWAVCFIPDVRHAPYRGSATGSVPECYDNTPFLYESAPPDPTWVTVRPGRITTGVDASLAVGSALSGRVEDPDGTPVVGAQVRIYGGNGNFDGRPSVTDASGSFRYTSMFPGTYTVCFSGDAATHGSSSTGYITQCQQVRLAAKHLTALPDITLARGGGVTGVVTTRAGRPLAGVSVNVSGSGYGFAVTDSRGRYAVRGLPTGAYAVCFYTGSVPVSSQAPTGYVSVCANGQVYTTNPTPDLSVVAGSAVTVDQQLGLGSGLRGRVTDTAGLPVKDVDVVVSDAPEAYVYTDADGRWSTSGVPAGRHTVCFYSFDGSARSECYDDASDSGSATPVRTRVNTFTTVDAVLSRGGTVVGVVTDAAGRPVVGVSVFADDPETGMFGYGQTDQAGHYVLSGLAPGTYAVSFDATFVADAPPTGYVSESFDDRTDGSFTPVVLGDGTTATADAVLAVGAEVKGTVTDSQGQPVPFVSVGINSTGGQGNGAQTDPSGRYDVKGIAPGSGAVCFYPIVFDPSAAPLNAECYDDVPTGGTPTPVELRSGETVTIDAALSKASGISGRVTDSRGSGIAYPTLALYDDYGYPIDYRSGNDDGTYFIPASEGGYGLCFSSFDTGPTGTGYVPECYDDRPADDPSPVVYVQGSTVTSGINAVLDDGAAVSGHVSSDPEATFDDVGIAVSTPGFDGMSLGGGNLDPDGGYTIIGLPSGPAQVCFYPGPASDGTLYANQCYDGQPADGSTPTTITLTAGVTTTGIDAVLRPS